MNATVSVVCYKWKTLSNQEHPLMIRVSKGGKKKFKSLGLSVHPDHWDFQTNRPNSICPKATTSKFENFGINSQQGIFS